MEASRESDYRGVGQVCVTQPGRQVERTHRLGHAHAGPARHPRVAVGHVGGRFLAMRLDALHPELLQFHHSAPQDRRDHEDVGHPVPDKHFGERLCTGHHKGRL